MDIQENFIAGCIVTTNPNTEKDIFPIVGIGASAGGLNAFTQLLKALPIDTGMAFVLVQHLDPKHVSLLPDLIKRTTAMPVIEISDNLRVEPNHIYVVPPTHSLALLHGVLQLLPRPDGRGKFLPIDDFFTSLAQDRLNHAIGIILSGTASDGTLGIQAIKSAGGITFAQTEDSAEYDGMPHSAIAGGHVDFILVPNEIAHKLVQIAHHPYLIQPLINLAKDVPKEETDLNKIFVLLRTRTGIDFTYYKHTTTLRRIKRRMMLHQLNHMKDYVKFLQHHPKELDILFQDVLINVTSFFGIQKPSMHFKKKCFPVSLNNFQMKMHFVFGCLLVQQVKRFIQLPLRYLNFSGIKLMLCVFKFLPQTLIGKRLTKHDKGSIHIGLRKRLELNGSRDSLSKQQTVIKSANLSVMCVCSQYKMLPKIPRSPGSI